MRTEKRRALVILNLLMAGIAVSACGEKPQGLGGVKNDEAPHKGTISKQAEKYADKNWKQGDQKSWESQMRARTQNGQNEYVKVQ